MTPWNFAKHRCRNFPTLDDVIDCVKYWLKPAPPPDAKCSYCRGPLNGSKRKTPFDCWECSDRCQYASECLLDDMEDGEYHKRIHRAWEVGVSCYKELIAWKLDCQQKYRQQLAEADPKDDKLFQELVNRGFEIFELDEHDVSEAFGMSLPSVRRWRAGKTFPHPVMRPKIYAWFAKQEVSK